MESLPANRQEIQERTQAKVAPCRCGRIPRCGFITNPVYRRRIEALIVRCDCGITFQEPIDFDETMAEQYPSAYEKAALCLYHWAKISELKIDGYAVASLDRRIEEAERAWRIPTKDVRVLPQKTDPAGSGNHGEQMTNPKLRYIGTKVICAVAMTRQAYNDLRGWTLPADENGADEGYLVEYLDGGKPNVEGYAGYVSWSPKEQFEKAYRISDAMTFGLAIEAMKMGKKVARAGWNGKGMFLFLVPGSVFKVNRPPLLGIYPEGTEIAYHAHIDMKTAQGYVVPWLASQADMLAEDWVVVE